MIFQDVYSNWFIQREVKPMTSMNWQQCIFQATVELSSIQELDYIKHRAISLTSNRKQIGKIRQQFHNFMKIEEKQFHEARRIELKKADEFFMLEIEHMIMDKCVQFDTNNTNINDQISF